ncbi:TonB-dependent receptor [Chitinimonas koreensis]|uniref:TonB-dependent receptor n=1 Tax=Chitinimonas koreensis TaxID=356302 RepID=UPI0003FDE4CB|nr:TonB-dependent receptor [Chitinimonas koreensis]QNM97219.1 TonB-dependent receptor [Chitinimonas koreensis]
MRKQVQGQIQPTTLAAAVALAFLGAGSLPVFAADAPPAPTSEQPAEIIQVKGIRSALQNSVRLKQNSTAIVDAVSAEDIGKMPDNDVGESLGRIPGVSVGRAFGQGSSVSVRGSDPQMTYTTLNGQTVASTGWYDQMNVDRSFNYSLLPSEMIGGMEVYKSPQADLTEGGIGGTVIVKTRKPLSADKTSLFGSVSYGDGSISDSSLDVSGLYNFKNAARTFGFLVAASQSEGDYIRRGVEADSRWSGDVAPTTFVQERKRKAYNIALQARPNSSWDLGVQFLGLDLEANNSNSSHYIFHDANCTQRNTAVKSDFNPNGICLRSSTTASNPLANEFMQVWARGASMSSDSLTFDAHYKGDVVKVDFVAGTTKADGGTDITTNYSYGSWGAGNNLPKWQGTIDATGKQIVISPSSNQTITVGNLAPNSSPETWATSRGPNEDEEKYGQADVTLNLDWGAINSFKTGVRKADHTFTKRAYRPIWSTAIAPVSTGSLFDGQVDVASWSIPRPNIDAMLSNTSKNITGWIEDRSAYGELNEDNTALYGMFTFEAENVRGNFGLRYIATKATSTTYAFDGTPLAAGDYSGNANWGRGTASTKASYNDVLPSVNVAFDLKKNLVLRASASQAITRPNFANMFGVTVAGYNDDRVGNETWTTGNINLKPMKSSQADLGIEYYYGKGNLASATFFTKEISNFVTTQTLANQKVGLVDPRSGVDNWTVQTYANAGGGTIRGIELQVNHSFDNGFGVLANYTLTEGNAPADSYNDKLGVFTQASKHNTNLVGFWENDRYSARLAYNWRSKYMIREGAFWYGDRMHDAYGTLDASFGWNINDNLRLSFEIANLLEEDDVQYGAAEASNPAIKDPLKAGYPAWSFEGERTFKLGLSAKF